jgi:hypothetical protein
VTRKVEAVCDDWLAKRGRPVSAALDECPAEVSRC